MWGSPRAVMPKEHATTLKVPTSRPAHPHRHSGASLPCLSGLQRLASLTELSDPPPRPQGCASGPGTLQSSAGAQTLTVVAQSRSAGRVEWTPDVSRACGSGHGFRGHGVRRVPTTRGGPGLRGPRARSDSPYKGGHRFGPDPEVVWVGLSAGTRLGVSDELGAHS